MTISKRAKGFPLQLSYQHYFIIQQLYPWLQSIDAIDEEMDEAYELLPKQKIDYDHVKDAQLGQAPAFMNYQSGFFKSRTIRIRARHIAGMVKLLKAASIFCHQGQAGGTIWRRAESLESISELDLLADAAAE